MTRGLGILNDQGLSPAQRKSQFQSFLLGLTDMRRIANFALGQYKRSATPQQQADFADAFQTYATAVYQSYFNRYSGQTLRVTGSTERAPGDTIVKTQMIDPKDSGSNQPLEVDFRVAGDGGRYQVIDFSVAGIWLALEERDQFSAFLGQHGGDVGALSQHLRELARTYK